MKFKRVTEPEATMQRNKVVIESGRSRAPCSLSRSLLFVTSLFVLLFVGSNAQAQNQGNIWYFGHGAGLDFNFTPPHPKALPNANSPFINTSEGCATISDNFGNALFWTDGTTIWDRANLPMHFDIAMGGALATLNGSSSSTQSAIIVPWPSTTKYYIFTTGAAEVAAHSGDLGYAIVDMSKIGSGTAASPNGAVTMGATGLSTNIINTTWTEKLTSVSDGQQGYWVIAHNYGKSTGIPSIGNTFYAFHITPGASGGLVSATAPVTSNIGRYQNDDDLSIVNAHAGMIGQMKASSDGTKLGLAVSYGGDPGGGQTPGRSDFVEIFKFDPATGIVSGSPTSTGSALLMLNLSTAPLHGDIYGFEFSPNGNLFYISTTQNRDSPFTDYIYQFSSSLTGTKTWTNGTLIASSAPAATPKNAYGALQLGPDKKIYVARPGQFSLGVIESPDLPGAGPTNCNFVDLSQPISDTCRVGLPAFVQGIFASVQPPPCAPLCDTAYYGVAASQAVNCFGCYPNHRDWRSINIVNREGHPINNITITYYDCNGNRVTNFSQLACRNLHVIRYFPMTNRTLPASHYPSPYMYLAGLSQAPSPSNENLVSFDISLPCNATPNGWSIHLMIEHINLSAPFGTDTCYMNLPCWNPCPRFVPNPTWGIAKLDSPIYVKSVALNEGVPGAVGFVSFVTADSTDRILGGNGVEWASADTISDGGVLVDTKTSRLSSFVQSRNGVLYTIASDTSNKIPQTFNIFIGVGKNGQDPKYRPKILLNTYDRLGGLLTTDSVVATQATSSVQPVGEAAPPKESIEITSVTPNPAHTSIEVQYTLGASEQAKLEIFNTLGLQVGVLADGYQTIGKHTAHFIVNSLAGGSYYLRLSTYNGQTSAIVKVVN